MKRFLNFFKKKTKPNYYLTKDYKGFPMYVINLPDEIDLQKDVTPEPQTIKEK